MIPAFRILLVDRFDLFRRFVKDVLQTEGGLLVIGEASDGLEAVQKAEDLKPDLVLLDVELPSLNGIEAARQIRNVAPTSKIIFLTQESDLEIVREALKTGAFGYVLKPNVVTELLGAVETVCSGKRFLSEGIRP